MLGRGAAAALDAAAVLVGQNAGGRAEEADAVAEPVEATPARSLRTPHQRDSTAPSVRPGRSRAISPNLLPSLRCSRTRMSSSAGVQGAPLGIASSATDARKRLRARFLNGGGRPCGVVVVVGQKRSVRLDQVVIQLHMVPSSTTGSAFFPGNSRSTLQLRSTSRAAHGRRSKCYYRGTHSAQRAEKGGKLAHACHITKQELSSL